VNERLVAGTYTALYHEPPGPHALAAWSRVVDAVIAGLADEWRAYGEQPSKHPEHRAACNWAACITGEFNR
jgi:hypothetical protein